MRIIHWQDFGSTAIGAWLCASPLFLGLTGIGAWTTVILGSFVILFAIEGLAMPSYFEELFEGLMGIALVVAPLSLGYGGLAATLNSVVAGILVVVLATSEMLGDQEFLTWWREGRPRMFA